MWMYYCTVQCSAFTWSFLRYCSRSILYHVLTALKKVGHTGWQPRWAGLMWPSLLTNIAGILSSYDIKSVFDPVSAKRITSAYEFVFGKELIYNSKDTLNSGPQTGSMSKSWSLPPGTKLPSVKKILERYNELSKCSTCVWYLSNLFYMNL